MDSDLETDGRLAESMVTAHRIRVMGLVFLGGSLGCAARYGISEGFSGLAPWITLMINICGAFLLGCLLEGLARRGPDTGRRRSARLLLGTGVLGGFTTYSALAVDTVLLLRQGSYGPAAGYALGTVLVGMVATWVGIVAAARWSRRQDAAAEGAAR